MLTGREKHSTERVPDTGPPEEGQEGELSEEGGAGGVQLLGTHRGAWERG